MTMFPMILLGVLLNAAAQLLLKQGMRQIGPVHMDWAQAMPMGLQVAANPYVLTGLFAYVVSVLVWLVVLSRVDVSFAYPMLSIGYIVNAIAAYYLFDESLSPTRMLGILVIIVGVMLVART
jgi:multidrug transporter EmrE-like cation transporter